MAAKDKVVFDVGGQRFSTTLQTLNRYPDSLLPAMCKDCCDAVGTGKEIHIDRSPEKFGWILEIYRSSEKQSLPPKWCLDDIEKELDFYQLPSATEVILFHGEMLVRMEKAVLKQLAEEICREMGAVGKEVVFRPFARIWVFAHIKDPDLPKLHALHMENAENVLCSSAVENFVEVSNQVVETRTAAGAHIVSAVKLMDKHVSILSELMLDLGLKISQEDIRTAHGVSRKAFVLKVTW